jgi:hypothetical protein
VSTLVAWLPSDTCALSDGKASRAVLVMRLLVPLAGVTVLALLARLGDTPSRARTLSRANEARGGVRGWVEAWRELFRKS